MNAESVFFNGKFCQPAGGTFFLPGLALSIILKARLERGCHHSARSSSTSLNKQCVPIFCEDFVELG